MGLALARLFLAKKRSKIGVLKHTLHFYELETGNQEKYSVGFFICLVFIKVEDCLGTQRVEMSKESSDSNDASRILEFRSPARSEGSPCPPSDNYPPEKTA